MEIDIKSPDGNIFAAMGIAANLMRQARRDTTDINRMRKAVMAAKSYKDACAVITEATFGSITFVNSDED